MSIKEQIKLNKISVDTATMKRYNAQRNVQRKSKIVSGYEYIVFANDRDLD